MGKHTIKRSPPVHRNCLDCGASFIAQNNEVAKGRGLFCSAKCRGKAQSKPLPSGVCQQCGEAMAKAEQMPDVARCVEASFVPGGVAT